ncbi:MAG: hemin uptake protein HemP [Pseudomonadota bacterium]
MERDMTAAPKAPPVIDARVLLAGSTTAHLLLDGQTYILRLTRAGKLILTK